MSEKYTVQNAIPTGKKSPTYGTEYHIKFVENDGTFKLWYKSEPIEGQVQEGDIDGWKFKKAKKEYDGGTDPVQKKWTPMKKDNSDGQRQGMAINNAANYLSAHSDGIVKPELWAKAVHTYAQALYALGDLNQTEGKAETQAEAKETITAQTVGDIFNGS